MLVEQLIARSYQLRGELVMRYSMRHIGAKIAANLLLLGCRMARACRYIGYKSCAIGQKQLPFGAMVLYCVSG